MLLSPLPAGVTSVTEVRFYSTPARDGTPVVAPVTSTGGVWSSDDTGVPDGRWYPTVVAEDSVGAAASYDLDWFDLPDDPALVVSAEAVAVKAKMGLPLSPDQRQTITEAILDAQSDVVAYLGRAITPELRTEYQRWAWSGAEWNLVALGDDDLIRVVSAVPETDPVTGIPSDYFTVTYLAGLEGRTAPDLRPIRRYVALAAMNAPEFVTMWRTATKAKGVVKSLSAEGQSVSFETPTLGGGGQAGSGMPGALPTIASLDRWRVAGRRVHQGVTRSSDWPFSGARWGSR
jgi:hypothetical protein